MMRVSLERFDELPAWDLEDFDEFIGPAGREHLAVRIEADAVTRIAVRIFDVHDERSGIRIEDLQFAVFAGSPAATCQQVALARESQRDHALGKPTELVSNGAGLSVPDNHFLETARRQE